MKVLIAEDSNAMRGIIREMMMRLGYDDIVEAEDGQQAWDHLTEQPFDLLLTDWNMPRMSGAAYRTRLAVQRGFDHSRVG